MALGWSVIDCTGTSVVTKILYSDWIPAGEDGFFSGSVWGQSIKTFTKAFAPEKIKERSWVSVFGKSVTKTIIGSFLSISGISWSVVCFDWRKGFFGDIFWVLTACFGWGFFDWATSQFFKIMLKNSPEIVEMSVLCWFDQWRFWFHS